MLGYGHVNDSDKLQIYCKVLLNGFFCIIRFTCDHKQLMKSTWFQLIMLYVFSQTAVAKITTDLNECLQSFIGMELNDTLEFQNFY